eukprot:GDKI01018183.1.p1 GENE.GDKI01018183.1~~GDKI01018183.1.p1  ORF type:complete len:350 (+),score=67.76 GDKI01018183.1:84-1052(+)
MSSKDVVSPLGESTSEYRVLAADDNDPQGDDSAGDDEVVQKESFLLRKIRKLVHHMEKNPQIAAVCHSIVVCVFMYVTVTSMMTFKLNREWELFGPFIGLFALTLLLGALFKLSLPLIVVVALQAAIVQVCNLYLEYLLSEWMGVDLTQKDRHNESEIDFWKYVALGAAVAALDTLAMFLICRQAAFSSFLRSPAGLAFYGMIVATVMGLVQILGKAFYKELANLPPIDAHVWRDADGVPTGFPAFWIFGMTALVCGGVCVGVGMQLSLATGGFITIGPQFLAIVLPFAFRLMGNLSAALYERFGHTHTPTPNNLGAFLGMQ